VLAAREALEARHGEDRQTRTARNPASQRAPNIRFWNAAAPQRRTIGGVPNGGYRTAIAASDCDVVLQPIPSVSDLIADYLAVHSPVGHAGGGAQIPQFWAS